MRWIDEISVALGLFGAVVAIVKNVAELLSKKGERTGTIYKLRKIPVYIPVIFGSICILALAVYLWGWRLCSYGHIEPDPEIVTSIAVNGKLRSPDEPIKVRVGRIYAVDYATKDRPSGGLGGDVGVQWHRQVVYIPEQEDVSGKLREVIYIERHGQVIYIP